MSHPPLPSPPCETEARALALRRVVAMWEDFFIDIEDETLPEADLFKAASAQDWGAALAACARGADPLARAFEQTCSVAEAAFFAQELWPLAMSPEAGAPRESALIAAALLNDEPLALRLIPLLDPFAPAGPERLSAFDACARSNLAGALAALLPSALAQLSPDQLARALHEGAAEGAEQACALLAPHCAPSARDEQGRSALMIAARHERALAALLPHSDPLLRDAEGQTALMLVAKEGSARACRLLAPASDLSARDHNGFTALMRAAQAGSPSKVAALLPGSPTRWVNFDSQSALILAAARAGRAAAACVRLLAPHSEARMEDKQEKNALILAIEANNGESVARLATRAFARARAFEGRTPLIHAVERDAERAVAALLPLSDPSAQSPGSIARGGGLCAFTLALSKRRYRAARSLLPAYEPFAMEQGQTLLAHLLSLEPANEDASKEAAALKSLLDRSFELWGDRSLPEDCSPEFFLALARGRSDWAERLLAGANARYRDPASGEDFLMSAIQSAPDWVARLIPMSDLSARSNDGVSALMMAAMGGRLEAVELLLPLSDPAMVNAYGLDALALAASNDNFECAEALLPHCDPTRLNWRGESAFFKALDSGNERLIRLLGPHAGAAELDLRGRDAFDALLDGEAFKGGWFGSQWERLRRLGPLTASFLRSPPPTLIERPLAERLKTLFCDRFPWEDLPLEDIEDLARAMTERCELNDTFPAKATGSSSASRRL